MNLAAALVAIGCLGPGEWSLDNAIDFAPSGWWSFAIVMVIGVGGTLGLLAVFWRPPAPKPARDLERSATRRGTTSRQSPTMPIVGVRRRSARPGRC